MYIRHYSRRGASNTAEVISTNQPIPHYIDSYWRELQNTPNHTLPHQTTQKHILKPFISHKEAYQRFFYNHSAKLRRKFYGCTTFRNVMEASCTTTIFSMMERDTYSLPEWNNLIIDQIRGKPRVAGYYKKGAKYKKHMVNRVISYFPKGGRSATQTVLKIK